MMFDRWACIDCGTDTTGEYYVVRHELWADAVGDPRAGKLCVGCLETRVGRRLEPDDFLPCPANVDEQWVSRKSDRLLDRMGL
jgi:hypothetical protein